MSSPSRYLRRHAATHEGHRIRKVLEDGIIDANTIDALADSSKGRDGTNFLGEFRLILVTSSSTFFKTQRTGCNCEASIRSISEDESGASRRASGWHGWPETKQSMR